MKFQEIIDSIEALSAEEQEYLWDLVSKRRIEHRREEIANQARALKLEFKEGRAKQGTINDLITDLLDNEDENCLE